jgi:hypothetical protein
MSVMKHKALRLPIFPYDYDKVMRRRTVERRINEAKSAGVSQPASPPPRLSSTSCAKREMKKRLPRLQTQLADTNY